MDRGLHPENAAAKDDLLADLLLSLNFGDGIRYDHSQGRWLLWEAGRWRPDRSRAIYDRIRSYTNMAFEQATDGERRKQLISLYDTGRKEGVLKSLSAREGIAMDGSEWDRDPYLLGFENGILDLRTATFDYTPSPETLVSRSVGYDWDPTAPYDIFEAFISSIFPGDQRLLDYVMRVLGYSLFGLTSEQKFWLWVGKGSNGKGTLARTALAALGDYAAQPSDTLYMRTRFGSAPSSAARPDLLKLRGVRFTAMSEPQGGHFNEELLKAHTGEDIIIARDLYGRMDDMVQFPPTHKIVFLTNDPPTTEDVGVSMARRVRVVKFEQDFSAAPNLRLEDELKTQLPGIMRLLAAYAMQWWNERALPETPEVTAWSKAYIEKNDPVAGFIKQSCVVDENAKGSPALLWQAYLEWTEAEGEEPMSQTAFGLALGRKFEKGKSNGVRVYKGIRSKNAMERALDDE